MKRKTRILVEVQWEDEISSPPSTWNWDLMLRRDPFNYSDETIKIVSFEDEKERDE